MAFNFKSVCVFCSSSDALDRKYLKLAEDIGNEIGKHNLHLIHGAGKIGLMGVLSRTAKENNCKVTGVIPQALNRQGITSETDDEIIVTDTMHERKKIMRDRADIFIALPGGFGTLEELLEVITLKQLRYHTKPIVIINYDHFYDNLIHHFDTMFEQMFSKHKYRSLYYIATDVHDAFNYLENYQYTIAEDKWFR
ncbi:MAG: TIGR00730 family Rossman fold protein [Bacteroidota bacterium]